MDFTQPGTWMGAVAMIAAGFFQYMNNKTNKETEVKHVENKLRIETLSEKLIQCEKSHEINHHERTKVWDGLMANQKMLVEMQREILARVTPASKAP